MSVPMDWLAAMEPTTSVLIPEVALSAAKFNVLASSHQQLTAYPGIVTSLSISMALTPPIWRAGSCCTDTCSKRSLCKLKEKCRLMCQIGLPAPHFGSRSRVVG